MSSHFRHVGGLFLAILLIGIGYGVGSGQVDIQWPFWPTTTTYSGDAIPFGNVNVGETKTANYTFKITEESETAGTITNIAFPGGYSQWGPFSLVNLPSLPTTLQPGESVTFQVTFSPTAAGSYSATFTITVQGGWPLQTKTQDVDLTGTGVGEGESIPPSDTYTGLADDVAKLEAKLDSIETTLSLFRQKLDNLGWWLGKLTVGYPIGIEPYSTNPMPDTNLWGLIARLEAKLDQLSGTIGEGTSSEELALIESKLDYIEAKLDAMIEQELSDVTIGDLNVTINNIYALILTINQLIIDLGDDQDKLEAKLDKLDKDLSDLADDLSDLWDDLFDMWSDLDDMWDGMNDRFDDVEDAIASNTNAIRALQASNARIEDKLNQLLGLPAMPATGAVTLAVTPETISAPDHTAHLVGAPGAVEGGATVNVYWLGYDNWVPGVTDPFYFDTLTAEPDGSFTLDKNGWGNSWPAWCEITQSSGVGESAPVRVYLSTVMIGM